MIKNSNNPPRISPNLRQARICDILSQREEASIGELAATFNVSEMTIRRDLDQLQREGQIQRTHGGAVQAERMVFEFDFVARRRSRQREKQAIAREALKLIEPQQRIILDTGTTTLELASLMTQRQGLTVITPSLAVASILQFSPNIQTVLLGGILRQGSPDLTGTVAEKVLEMFMVDIAFQGADGINLDGEIFCSDVRIAHVDQKMRRRARKTYILSDSSKIGKDDVAANGSLADIDGFITDSNLKPEHAAALEERGVHIIIAED